MTKFVNSIKNMINKNINSLPEIDKKVNAMATLTPIIKSESDKIDETGRNTVIGKVLSFVEGAGGVKAEAWGCSVQGYLQQKAWWGALFRINKCAQKWAIAISGAIFAAWFVGLAGCTASTGGLCGGLFSIGTTLAIRATQVIWGLATNPNCQWVGIKVTIPFLSISATC